ncbi:hypothetical protein [Streptomyces sp. NPDC020917]|uniref:hypothetical protein n=1 Tax=Streptomyces sp. NPDC020917 TaxID=3365102 RepID=UPI0037BBC024
MTHRKPRKLSSVRAGRSAVRWGMLTTAGLTTLATAGTAHASGGIPHDVGVAVDQARTIATRVHPVSYQESFTVHQFGALVSATANNRAVATSIACRADDPCRSIALSFQIVTTAGTNIRLHASNLGKATNVHCPECETFAGAYQFVVSTPGVLTLDSGTRHQLDLLSSQAYGLGHSNRSVADIKQRADALAAQVVSVLRGAVASAPRTQAVDPLKQFQPTVTMHRYVS